MKNTEYILQSFKSRSAWYDKAIKMAQREIPWESGFNWPLYGKENSPLSPLNIPYWKGAKEELDNAIYVLEQ